MAVERYRVNLSVVVEVENPEALVALARSRAGNGAPASIVDMLVPGTASALEQVINLESAIVGLPGVAHVSSTTRAVLLSPHEQ